jgi:hypothetical protein
MVNVYVCLNSQHSRWRISQKFTQYPQLINYIPLFYGNYFNLNRNLEIPNFDDMNLTEFFNLTNPEMVVLRVNSSSGFLKFI